MKNYNKYLMISLCLITNALGAQNYLYNTEQFGLMGSMLGGVITAGSNDISTIYYNPAAINRVTSGIDLSLIQPRINRFGFDQFWAGEDSSVSTNIKLKPALIAFKSKWKGRDLAFIKIGKSSWNDTFRAKRETLHNSTQTIQNFEYEYRGNDNWYGVGTSFVLNHNLSIGVSQFVSIADYHYRTDVLYEVTDIDISPDQSSEYFNSALNSDYSNIGFITKVGLIYDTDRFDVGMTITSPMFFHMFKKGNFNRSRIIINSEKTTIEGIIDSKLSPRVKTPLEINLGCSIVFNSNNKLWFNGMYHSEIPEYVMAEIQSITGNVNWTNGNKSIFNFGLGFTNKISSHLELSGGVRTNKFAYENKNSSQNSIRNVILDTDHIHYTITSKFIYKKNTILVGFDWGPMSNNANSDDFRHFSDIDAIAPQAQNLTKSSISILFTYGFILAELNK